MRYYTSSMLPPAFSIAFLAASDAFCTFTCTFAFSSPFARSFKGRLFLFNNPAATKDSVEISVTPFAANASTSLRLITLYFVVKRAFENPFNFGSLLNSGVCPHSNQSGTPPPDLAFCPLHPLVENVPFPEPFPLPTLLDENLEPSSGLIVCNNTIINNLVINDYPKVLLKTHKCF